MVKEAVTVLTVALSIGLVLYTGLFLIHLAITAI